MLSQNILHEFQWNNKLTQIEFKCFCKKLNSILNSYTQNMSVDRHLFNDDKSIFS